jgi:hypothetical protein
MVGGGDAQMPLPLERQLAASARARRVFPVPGGPWKRTPRGGVTLKRWKTSGYSSGSSVISFSACISAKQKPVKSIHSRKRMHERSSNPPTSSNVTFVFTPKGSASANAASTIRHCNQQQHTPYAPASPILPKFDGVPAAAAARSPGNIPPPATALPNIPAAVAPNTFRGVLAA